MLVTAFTSDMAYVGSNFDKRVPVTSISYIAVAIMIVNNDNILLSNRKNNLPMKPEWSVSALLNAASISKPIFVKNLKI